MEDYDLDDISCPGCGNDTTHSRPCSEITCEDGGIDESAEDFLKEGTNVVPCDTCKGTGIERWCPSCGKDLSGVEITDDEDEQFYE